MKLTVIIPTYNEEKNIEAALDSVAWADDLWVVDSFSIDRTKELVENYRINQTGKVRFSQREYLSPPDQKNWAIENSPNDWILLLDADERVTTELAAEIQDILKKEPDCKGYWIRRQNYFMGKRIRFSGWQGDRVIRLIHKKYCYYPEVRVHEEITCNEKVGVLKNPLLHYTYTDLKHFVEKQDKYARWAALDLAQKNKKVTWFHLYLKPAFRFFKHYIIGLGILDGKQGFIISRLMAWGVYKRYWYLKNMKYEI